MTSGSQPPDHDDTNPAVVRQAIGVGTEGSTYANAGRGRSGDIRYHQYADGYGGTQRDEEQTGRRNGTRNIDMNVTGKAAYGCRR